MQHTNGVLGLRPGSLHDECLIREAASAFKLPGLVLFLSRQEAS